MGLVAPCGVPVKVVHLATYHGNTRSAVQLGRKGPVLEFRIKSHHHHTVYIPLQEADLSSSWGSEGNLLSITVHIEQMLPNGTALVTQTGLEGNLEGGRIAVVLAEDETAQEQCQAAGGNPF